MLDWSTKRKQKIVAVVKSSAPPPLPTILNTYTYLLRCIIYLSHSIPFHIKFILKIMISTARKLLKFPRFFSMKRLNALLILFVNFCFLRFYGLYVYLIFLHLKSFHFISQSLLWISRDISIQLTLFNPLFLCVSSPFCHTHSLSACYLKHTHRHSVSSMWDCTTAKWKNATHAFGFLFFGSSGVLRIDWVLIFFCCLKFINRTF